MEPCRTAAITDRVWGRKDQGFTLVEVLIALTLLGLVSVMLFASLKLGVRAWEAGNASAGQLSAVEVAQNLLRTQLREARQLPLGPGAPHVEFTFAGSSDELRFSAPMPAHLGMGGHHIILLSTDGAGARRDLVLRWRIYRPDMSIGDDRWSEPLLLLHGIVDISIDYFGHNEEEEQSAWRETWDHEEMLPELVRLRVAFAGDDRRRWPELIVAPRVRQVEPMQ